MGTKIAIIKGRRELYSEERKECNIPKYTKSTIHINRFYSGIKKGRMLSLSIDDKYIQLTKTEIDNLIKILQNSFDDNIYPSE